MSALNHMMTSGTISRMQLFFGVIFSFLQPYVATVTHRINTNIGSENFIEKSF